MTKLHVLIPCAGSGSRFNSNLAKQYHQLLHQTALDWSLSPFLSLDCFSSINIVHQCNDPQIAVYKTKYPLVNFLADGGITRGQSVLNGLKLLLKQHSADDWVLVHDAARVLLHRDDLLNLINSVVSNAKDYCGGILAKNVRDTVKQVAHNSLSIIATIARETIYLAQTPQMFPLGTLHEALARSDLNHITDEASAIELMAKSVQIVITKHENFKLTKAEDLLLAKFILQQRAYV